MPRLGRLAARLPWSAAAGQPPPTRSSDFPAAPLRIYNFTAGSLSSVVGGAPADLTVQVTGTGTAAPTAGADGSALGAYAFARDAPGTNAGYLRGDDTGLVPASGKLTVGLWFRVGAAELGGSLLKWGGTGTRVHMALNPGGNSLEFECGGIVATTYRGGELFSAGGWHFAVGVVDTSQTEKVRLYLDGAVVARSETTPGSVVPAGSTGLTVGAGSSAFDGAIDGFFVADQALTAEQVRALYARSSTRLPVSPKNAGDHVEAITSGGYYVVGDTLAPWDQLEIRGTL